MRHNLIQARHRKNMSQLELAEMIGVTRQAICKLERGHMNGSERTWQKLSAVLKAKPEYLWQIADDQQS